MPALEENSGEASDQRKQNCSTHPIDADGPVVSCCFVMWLLAEFLVCHLETVGCILSCVLYFFPMCLITDDSVEQEQVEKIKEEGRVRKSLLTDIVLFL